ncbi:MAG: glutathione peroxidase [Clostridioides sp.]|jgi:glutathione peroxidase|nr:glutathione peroxidase [Clostridioides sp.]
MSVYGYNYKTIEGKDASLEDFKGKLLLIVNTASKCGFTPQYEGLEDLYKKYKDRGFTILGMPCNQFDEQDPGSNEEIHEFCKVRFGVSFPLSQKIEVRGEGQDPLYKYLTENTKFNGFGTGEMAGILEPMLKERYGAGYEDSNIKWNFTKFLIGKDGEIIERFEPTTEPKELESIIEKNL